MGILNWIWELSGENLGRQISNAASEHFLAMASGKDAAAIVKKIGRIQNDERAQWVLAELRRGLFDMDRLLNVSHEVHDDDVFVARVEKALSPLKPEARFQTWKVLHGIAKKYTGKESSLNVISAVLLLRNASGSQELLHDVLQNGGANAEQILLEDDLWALAIALAFFAEDVREARKDKSFQEAVDNPYSIGTSAAYALVGENHYRRFRKIKKYPCV